MADRLIDVSKDDSSCLVTHFHHKNGFMERREKSISNRKKIVKFQEEKKLILQPLDAEGALEYGDEDRQGQESPGFGHFRSLLGFKFWNFFLSLLFWIDFRRCCIHIFEHFTSQTKRITEIWKDQNFSRKPDPDRKSVAMILYWESKVRNFAQFCLLRRTSAVFWMGSLCKRERWVALSFAVRSLQRQRQRFGGPFYSGGDGGQDLDIFRAPWYWSNLSTMLNITRQINTKAKKLIIVKPGDKLKLLSMFLYHVPQLRNPNGKTLQSLYFTTDWAFQSDAIIFWEAVRHDKNM